MRAHEFITEMPMTAYKPLGDFKKSGPFTGVDKKLVVHPKSELKTAKFFQKTPYDFRLFFSNIPGTGKYRERGPIESGEVHRGFGKYAPEILAGSDDAINVIFVGNVGEAKVMLTPWMMAHRFGHAINAEGGMNRKWSPWTELERHFFGQIDKILEDFYNVTGADWYGPQYAAFFNAIGTQRSSRTGKIKRPFEFLYEMLAQYLATGHVKFNPLPARIPYGSKAWGKSTREMKMIPEYENTEDTKSVMTTLGNDMEIMFGDVLAQAVGRIFVI